MSKTIVIADDFTKYTGLRYKSLTPGSSGEEFRDELLIPALEENDIVTIIFDGNIGEYVPSFLEECFGGLIRIKKYSFNEFEEKIQLVSKDTPDLIKSIIKYVKKETG